MAFFKKAKKSNYDLWSDHAWYVPGVGGMFLIFGLFVAGALLGALAQTVMMLCLGPDTDMEYGMLVSYPVQFLPPIVYAGVESRRNRLFDAGYSLDSDNFAPYKGWLLAVLCVVGTWALAFCMDLVNSAMPQMPQQLEDSLSAMTGGPFLLDFVLVSVMAPLFEEWLVRGMVLRGLLNHRRPDGSTMKPAGAIVISALFFAVIHANPWQAVPAFALGCLFGYVYWKTGSLKLTMAMHCANNTMALVVGQMESLEASDTWLDLLGTWWFAAVFIVAVAFLVFFFAKFRRIGLPRPQGGTTEIPEGVV